MPKFRKKPVEEQDEPVDEQVVVAVDPAAADAVGVYLAESTASGHLRIMEIFPPRGVEDGSGNPDPGV